MEDINKKYRMILKECDVHNITVKYADNMSETFLVQFPNSLNKNKVYKILGKITEWAREHAAVECVFIDKKPFPRYNYKKNIKMLPTLDFKTNYLISLVHKNGIEVKIAYHCTTKLYFGEVVKIFTDRSLPLGRLDGFYATDLN